MRGGTNKGRNLSNGKKKPTHSLYGRGGKKGTGHSPGVSFLNRDKNEENVFRRGNFTDRKKKCYASACARGEKKEKLSTTGDLTSKWRKREAV